MTANDFLDLANSPAGIAALTLFILYAGAKEVWVWGKAHRTAVQRERDRADEWKDIATGGLQLADRAVTKLEKDS